MDGMVTQRLYPCRSSPSLLDSPGQVVDLGARLEVLDTKPQGISGPQAETAPAASQRAAAASDDSAPPPPRAAGPPETPPAAERLPLKRRFSDILAAGATERGAGSASHPPRRTLQRKHLRLVDSAVEDAPAAASAAAACAGCAAAKREQRRAAVSLAALTSERDGLSALNEALKAECDGMGRQIEALAAAERRLGGEVAALSRTAKDAGRQLDELRAHAVKSYQLRKQAVAELEAVRATAERERERNRKAERRLRDALLRAPRGASLAQGAAAASEGSDVTAPPESPPSGGGAEEAAAEAIASLKCPGQGWSQAALRRREQTRDLVMLAFREHILGQEPVVPIDAALELAELLEKVSRP